MKTQPISFTDEREYARYSWNGGGGGGGGGHTRMHIEHCPSIHVAFYLWYGTPSIDGQWRHWDHAELPHWDERVRKQYRHGTPFLPPEEPHSPFYPARGLYSSRDRKVLGEQMREIAATGISSVMLSWWGQAAAEVTRDSQGVSTDELVPAVLDAAAAAGVGVTWHIEPYGARSARSVLGDLQYLASKYGEHPAIYRQKRRDGKSVPIVFLYDVSAQHSGDDVRDAAAQWRSVSQAIRGTPADALLLSLFLEPRDVAFVVDAGLDGAYTYFASAGFTRGSDPSSWRGTREAMAARGLWFVPSVGPGYNDTLIRPWNTAHTKSRDDGEYYNRFWRAAIDATPPAVTITSYNEWGEGTQIEPARSHTSVNGSVYADYSPLPPDFYLQRTRAWVEEARRGCKGATPPSSSSTDGAEQTEAALSNDEL